MHRILVIAAVAATLAGCATSGYGRGALTSPMKPGDTEGEVYFTWDAGVNPVSGTIAATLPDGRIFQGRFMQITSESRAVSMGSYGGWGGGPWGYGYGGYGGWGYSGIGGGSAYVTQYTGRVVATLEGPDGQRMRCFFVLEDPPSGPDSGGQGECELSTGERVDAAVLRSGDDD